MPAAIFLSRVSAANAFCSAICGPGFEVLASTLKPDFLQACQLKFQSIIAAFQESSDALKSTSTFNLQGFISEFDGLCADLNVLITAALIVQKYFSSDSSHQVALPKELQDALQSALLTQPGKS